MLVFETLKKNLNFWIVARDCMVIVFSLDWRNISVLLSFQFEKEKWAGCPLLESKQQQKMMTFGVLYLVFSHQPIQ